jgi:hypothetical protein
LTKSKGSLTTSSAKASRSGPFLPFELHPGVRPCQRFQRISRHWIFYSFDSSMYIAQKSQNVTHQFKDSRNELAAVACGQHTLAKPHNQVDFGGRHEDCHAE